VHAKISEFNFGCFRVIFINYFHIFQVNSNNAAVAKKKKSRHEMLQSLQGGYELKSFHATVVIGG
jgi:hypothetical protein